MPVATRNTGSETTLISLDYQCMKQAITCILVYIALNIKVVTSKMVLCSGVFPFELGDDESRVHSYLVWTILAPSKGQ